MDAQETRLFTLVLILVVVLGSIILFFFVSMIRQQRINLELKKQNITSELNSIEKERARIAADLHDDLSPILSAVKLKVSSFELHSPIDQQQQQKTNEHLNSLLKRMREIAFNLMPVTLQRKGLVAALEELVFYWYSQSTLHIDLTAEEIFLSESYSVHIYRIVQEIVHNTVKHAGASLLQIELKREGDKLILSTRDNGKGFRHQQKLVEGGGFGLRSLLSRTDVLGGELFIDSKEGKGTVYTIAVPLS